MSALNQSPTTVNSAEILEGMELDNGWKVGKLFQRLSPDFSGGNFSRGYIVQNSSGNKAFLKALDYSMAFQADDVLAAMNFLTSAFMFERNILEKCKNLRLDRVVTPICYGQVKPPTGLYPVNYLIFDLADGDIRKFISFTKDLDLAWILRSIHHTTVVLNQLHTHGMAHQDLKPSNVLIFNSNSSKIGDMGRAIDKGALSPHEYADIAGDLTYAPPELLYGYVDPNWAIRRYGCDFYLLGSHILFLFTGTSMTSAIRAELDPQHYHEKWGGTYSEVLPYLRVAYDSVIETFTKGLDVLIKDELTAIVRQLSDPDIVLRGLTKGTINNKRQFSLEWYISRFDVLAKRAELKIRRV